LLPTARLIGHSARLSLHEIDVEPLDPHALIREPIAQGGKIVDNRRAGRFGLGLQVGDERTVLHLNVQPQRTKLGRAKAKPHFAVTFLSRGDGPGYAAKQARRIDFDGGPTVR
jgi:hypothetical protein